MISIEEKYQACNLCDSLCRNINDNFKSVSFEIMNNGDIQIKIILLNEREEEKDNINDFIGEFVALQDRNCVLDPIIQESNALPLKNIVYNIVI
jgi:hypothetical protein